jgi:phage terminase large subunit-like protein
MGLAGPNRQVIKLPVKHNRGYKINVSGKTLADRVISFIESLPITSGILAGRTFKLDKWQRDIVKGIYRTDKKGKRIVRQALITMPRKNGKTGLTAALALAHLCGPVVEKRGQVYSAAAARDQAAHIYREMKAIVTEVPELRRRIIIRDFTKQLEDVESGSTYFALSADANTKYGYSASFIVYDELAQASDRRLYDALTTSSGARAEPLTVVISTQSPDSESIMSELVDYGIRVLNGEEDPTFYPVIYTAPEDADPWDEDVWRACNPALKSGFRDFDEMKASALQAQRIPAREATFRLLYLNQRINVQARFVDMTEWDACDFPVDRETLKGKLCYAGLDLASTTDIAALVLLFPGERYSVLPFFFIPEDMNKRTGAEKTQLQNWISRGLITATPGNQIDYDWILKTIEDCRRDFNLKLLAFDDWGSHKIINDLCKNLGFTVDEKEARWGNKPLLNKVRQGFKTISAPTKELLSYILSRKIAHGGNPVLRSMANNASIEVDPAGNIKPVKSTETGRIDGIYALIMALDAAIVREGDMRSIYGEREMRFL